MKKIILYIVVLIFSACITEKNTTNSKLKSTRSEQSEMQSVLWQQTAAEYEALCYQAFNIASYRISKLNQDQSAADEKKLAVILDLDETVLDNSPYNGYLLLKNQSYTSETWVYWTSKAKAALVPGAKDFIDLARKYQIEVFFVSNRKVSELKATLDNLQKRGIDIDENKVLLKTTSSEKASRRATVYKDYKVIMLIGDNLADFDNNFEEQLTITERKELVEELQLEFGKKFIILPNVMYGDWQKTLRNKDNKSIEGSDFEDEMRFIKSF